MIVEKTIVAMRGRDSENPDCITEQRLEPNTQGICNTITSVQKDNLVLERKTIKEGLVELGDESFWNFLYEIDGEIQLIRIRKLIPLECGRLMGVSDEDCEKILAVESNSQAYKAFGNSIVVDVLKAIFSQMNIKGVTPWNESING